MFRLRLYCWLFFADLASAEMQVSHAEVGRGCGILTCPVCQLGPPQAGIGLWVSFGRPLAQILHNPLFRLAIPIAKVYFLANVCCRLVYSMAHYTFNILRT